MFRELERHGVRWESVVDLGCGNGDWTAELAARSGRLVAVDFTSEFLDACRRRIESVPGCDVRFVASDLASYEFDSECDLVVAGAVTQYLDDREVHALVSRVRAALAKRAGLLYLRTTIVKRGGRQSTNTSEYQAIYRSVDWYLDALKSAGFTVLTWRLATDFVAEEFGYRSLGRAGWLVAWPLRLVRHAYRAVMRKDILVCVARPGTDAGGKGTFAEVLPGPLPVIG